MLVGPYAYGTWRILAGHRVDRSRQKLAKNPPPELGHPPELYRSEGFE